jgi:hypothetical protein
MMLVPATPGMQGCDTDTVLDEAGAQALAASGFRFVVRYLSRTTPEHTSDLTSGEVDIILGAGLLLGAVQHVSRAGWSPNAALGAAYGSAAAANAGTLGFPNATQLWLDLEGVASYVSAADTIAYVNSWATVVTGAGFVPGLYVGANQPLSGDDLYWRLKVTRYWKSASNVPDIPYRGYCMVQSLAPSPIDGISIDRDVVLGDAFGGVPTFLAS